MKSLTILFFTLSYLTTYLGISYLINYAWNLEMSFIELLVIGLIFSILLIVLLVFDVPEKIADKLSRKPEVVVVYKDSEPSEDFVEDEVVDFFERKEGEGGVKIEENQKERVVEPVS